MDNKSKNIRNVILNMLKIRGYVIPENRKDFTEVNSTEFLTYKIDNEKDKIYVFFPETPKVGVNTIREYIKEMDETETNRAIIVVKETITAFAKQVFSEIKPKIIQYFTEPELAIDITKHILVPKHELVSNEVKKEIMNIYNLKEYQFHTILGSDPIAKYFGAKKGQLFKVTRPSETAGTYINYRIVA